MKTSFLEYYKVILDKVRFDVNLFQKEYNKARKYLTAHEQAVLDEWLNNCGWLTHRIEAQNNRQYIPKQRLPF